MKIQIIDHMNIIIPSSIIKGNRLFGIVCFLLVTTTLSAQRLWINEVAITPNPADDFIEIVVDQNADLSKVEMVFYMNGQQTGLPVLNAATDFTQASPLAGFVLFTTPTPIDFNHEIALLYDGVVVEFLSFNNGGFIVASNGPAEGYPSQDLTVDVMDGMIYRQGSNGVKAADFTFTGTTTSTEGTINDGQTFGTPLVAATLDDTPVAPASEPVPSGSNIEYILEIQNSGAGSADSAVINRTTPLDPNTTYVPGSFKSTPVAYDYYVMNAQEDLSKTLGLKGVDLDGNQGMNLTFMITSGPSQGSLGAILPSAAFNVIACTTSGTPPAFKGISLTNGTQIGSSGISFYNTSVLNAVVGIELDGTGTNSFVVAGDGSMARNGSGGELDLCGTGLRLVNAFNVSMNAVDITNISGDAINSIGGGDFTFSSIEVTNPTGNGWYARNLTGTNRINQNSLFQNINNNSSSAIDLRNSTANLTLLEINNTQFTNSTSSRSTVLIEQEGSADMEVRIINACLFDDLFGQAVTSQAGQAPGSTGTLTTLIDNSSFTAAKMATGENNIALIANHGATQAATVSGNTLSQIGKGGGVANTSILRTQNDGGTWTGVIGATNNLTNFTFNIGGRHGIGHVASGQSTTVEATTILKIDNNIVQELGEREGVYTSTREFINSADIVVEDNTIGTVTTLRGVATDQEIMEFQVRADNMNAYTLDLVVRNNVLRSSHPGTTFEVGHIGIPVFDNAGINATISNNTVTGNTNISHIGLELEDGNGCFNISGNNLTPMTPEISFGAFGTGVFNVTQASQGILQSSNSSANISLVSTPTVNYNSPACTLPSNN